jgi:hypothetical protein
MVPTNGMTNYIKNVNEMYRIKKQALWSIQHTFPESVCETKENNKKLKSR